eukprot:CAMPEP_0202868458 /NCGR_PEP_ID=MMETSP1391-20130828/10891_1 /ASSEMBLY_ACC=CAM_ASM_000867 /TAXON_ID=1034604 /ORGANISM="Chlamydomonas leiostraca, Strain SAG 11-49" /LENGTH=107 /DNA_ID=CAMNT_0049548633 /DNA_START=239 /DNA_END=558 /DNA_ORIENTATION=+
MVGIQAIIARPVRAQAGTPADIAACTAAAAAARAAAPGGACHSASTTACCGATCASCRLLCRALRAAGGIRAVCTVAASPEATAATKANSQAAPAVAPAQHRGLAVG